MKNNSVETKTIPKAHYVYHFTSYKRSSIAFVKKPGTRG